ncbi:hypothetical protein IV203_036696 [Nitzschia inconspicua]|uniref:PPIase cyclophilin-type domain-containing protein n=1 Tax=Nitzschia inconspicua TaxID=303405 RepID=A0A9K3LFP1_9STRA|nr:hypothetical protein IV203_036696 [Nitzschia inconspicua]
MGSTGSGTAAAESASAETSKTAPDTTTTRLEPVFHSILKSCILIGLGVIAGYGLFHAIFRYRCADVLDEMERGHNQSLASLTELYQKSVDDHQQCLNSEDKTQEIYELRGRLEAQSDLVASHRSLLQKHQVSTSRLEEMELLLQQKEAELFIIQKRIDLRNQEKEELEKELDELKQSIVVELGEKTEMIQSLESSVQAFQATEREYLNHIQTRHAVMSRQFFGKGPYYVKFSLDLPGHGDSFFVAEIATRRIFPLSVFTLLTLVESGFYNDLTMVNEGNGAVVLGSTSEGNGKNLEEKLLGLGFLGGASMYFAEWSSEYPCPAGALGFIDRGPSLHFHAMSGEEGDYHSCFAEVIRGMDILQAIHEALRDGGSLRLTSAIVLLSSDEGDDKTEL